MLEAKWSVWLTPVAPSLICFVFVYLVKTKDQLRMKSRDATTFEAGKIKVSQSNDNAFRVVMARMGYR